VDAALLRLGQTLSESVVAHATTHETGGSDPITALAATVLTSGVLADARVQESNVTQHQAALSITESQISDLNHAVAALADIGDVTRRDLEVERQRVDQPDAGGGWHQRAGAHARHHRHHERHVR
jgi:hypothetical protein